MNLIHRTVLAAAVLLSAPLAHAQANEPVISDQLHNLRLVSTAQRPAATAQLAAEIRALPAGQTKLQFAASLASRSTEGDSGFAVLQAVADTLTQALAESPVPATGDQPPRPYFELAKLVRYEGVSTSLADPLLAKAARMLAANDADIEKASFTLADLHGKKVTLSELRGKIVLVNFWATWCLPCLMEMPDLDALYTRYQSQGLVVLSISNESEFKVSSFMERKGYHLPVLLDPDNQAITRFHVDGFPRSFVFNREGKLAAQAINQRTQRQFMQMLAKAGLQP
jgi:peroxiredoxin